ncbi:MAG TPA: DUF58 domain-containing protein [Gammaproteobacteria bacterium]
MFQRLKSLLRDRVHAWADKRQGRDADSVVLVRRRIYILPTRQGVVFGVLLFAMLLGSMNYSSSLGFVVTFMLASLGFVAMHHTHRNLENLELRAGHATSVFAGDEACFPIFAVNRSAVTRGGIALDNDANTQDIRDLAPDSIETLNLRIAAKKRGWLRPRRFGIHTTYPFGLFRAWAWLRMDLECLVYPAPAPRGDTPLPAAFESGSGRIEASGNEDFSGLRNYRAGDSPRHVAWRASARTDGELLVKEFHGGGVATRWLDWEQTQSESDVEARLGRLARWVMDAHAGDEHWGLRLPGVTIPLDTGEAHYERCLRALALFPSASGAQR